MTKDPQADNPSANGSGRSWLGIFLKGVFMGAADTVPGISGGTIALITGIYERLVTAIAALDPRVVWRLPKLRQPAERAAFFRRLDDMDLAFLLVLGLGIVSAIVTVSRVLELALHVYRGPTNAFFFGLIAASAVLLYDEVNLGTSRRVIAAVGGVAAAFWLTGATAGGEIPHSAPILFVAGAIASSAMLLPGISGAALLYVLGQYEFMIGVLQAFIEGVPGVVFGGPTDDIVAPAAIIIVFIVGVGIGLLTVARAVRWALSADRATTLTLLVSLMVGALRLPAAEVLSATQRWTAETTLIIVVAGVVGAVAVLVLDWLTDDLEY